jgi:hypothetical protein
VLDYHRSDCQAELRRLAGGSVPVAVNAVRGAAPGLQSLVSAGGRLATITNEPLQSERGISVSGFFVSPSGALLERQAASFAERGLTIPVGAVYGLAEAGTALNAAVAGGSAAASWSIRAAEPQRSAPTGSRRANNLDALQQGRQALGADNRTARATLDSAQTVEAARRWIAEHAAIPNSRSGSIGRRGAQPRAPSSGAGAGSS